jgi:electron transfer flavoprotein beta subunit
MRIVVLLKEVPDTWGDRKLDTSTGILDRGASDAVIDEISERAIEVALTAKDADSSVEVVVLSMGPATVTAALRKALAMGATSAVHVVDAGLAGADLGLTARALAAAIRTQSPDLVIAGNESTDGRGGVIPAMIAEHLGSPALTFLNSVSITADGVSGARTTEYGDQSVSASFPAVISINEQNPDARFASFKGIMGAKKKSLTEMSLADLDLDASGSSTSIVSTTERPARTAGTIIEDEGNAGIAIADFLASRRLI